MPGPASLPDPRGRTVAVAGLKGRGKTTLLGNMAREYGPSIIIDPVGSSPDRNVLIDYADLRIELDTVPELDQLRALLKKAKSDTQGGQVLGIDASGLFGQERMQLGDRLGKACLLELSGWRGVTYWDEVQWFVPNGQWQAYTGLVELAGKGRNHDVGTVISCHRWQQPDRNLVEIADAYVQMGMHGDTNLAAAKRLLGDHVDPASMAQLLDALPTFQPGQFVVVEA